ncbi:riboflavin synthase [Varunaivibrio sulfuroxidans]|uniref:Riboflavin synthase n=1 Tax=Varunaivibrio sulfuroxidans TaxID=1773489 RepID=A0A4V2UP20_9PROT|nr:riboflavin synthase [Varunaivibrio sulfuroxidans]TCS64261.1 riboflavin synthase alpha chain [Varunaivibrio sulfuroxidans]WES31301.1 riboflavin synthase [Varunaivibrio sulfuroxidans]
MFTGIITDIGTLRDVRRDSSSKREAHFTIATAYDTTTIDIGASIACAGACMTVTQTGPDWFRVTASGESLSKTTMGAWTVGARINLERALRLGDELGGHLVSGHVDDVGEVTALREDGESLRITVRAPGELARFISPKGSVVIDGVSLTVNETDGACFGVNIIPHTQQATTLSSLGVNSRVNLEIDMLARYVARLLEKE